MKLMNLSPPPGQAGHPSWDPTTLKPPHTDENLFWLHHRLITQRVATIESVPISQKWDKWELEGMELEWVGLKIAFNDLKARIWLAGGDCGFYSIVISSYHGGGGVCVDKMT
jgi:hypothetical protein